MNRIRGEIVFLQTGKAKLRYMKQRLQLYAAPSVRVLGLNLEDVVCASTVNPGGMSLTYDNPFGDTEYDL